MTSALTPRPGTIVIFSDTWCAFAHVAVYRLHESRRRLRLEERVTFDHRAFPMELLNGNPGSRPGSDSEVPSVGNREPAAGWQLWQDKDWLYPSSTLPALEAVQAAKAQSPKASEDLDLALRRAFLGRVALHHEPCRHPRCRAQRLRSRREGDRGRTGGRSSASDRSVSDARRCERPGRVQPPRVPARRNRLRQSGHAHRLGRRLGRGLPTHPRGRPDRLRRHTRAERRLISCERVSGRWNSCTETWAIRLASPSVHRR